MKLLKKIMIALIVLGTLALSLAGCKDKVKGDKADIATVMSTHKAKTAVKSNYNADIDIKVYTAAGDLDIQQCITWDRLLDGDKYYANASLRSGHISDNILEILKTFLKSAGAGDSNLQGSPLMDYLEGKTKFCGELGYDDGVYNGRAVYTEVDKTPAYSGNENYMWVAGEDSELDKFLEEIGYGGPLRIADFLMFSTLDEVVCAAGIERDNAGVKYDEERGAFKYMLDIRASYFKEYVKNRIDGIVADIDYQRYKEYIEVYKYAIPIVLSWLHVETFAIDIYTDKDGNIIEMESDIKVLLNIKRKEVLDLVKRVLIADNKTRLGSKFDENKPLSAEDDQFVSLVNTMMVLLTDSNGQIFSQSEYFSLAFGFKTRDVLSYGDIDFSGVDADLYLPLTVDRDDRDILTA